MNWSIVLNVLSLTILTTAGFASSVTLAMGVDALVSRTRFYAAHAFFGTLALIVGIAITLAFLAGRLVYLAQ